MAGLDETKELNLPVQAQGSGLFPHARPVVRSPSCAHQVGDDAMLVAQIGQGLQ